MHSANTSYICTLKNRSTCTVTCVHIYCTFDHVWIHMPWFVWTQLASAELNSSVGRALGRAVWWVQGSPKTDHSFFTAAHVVLCCFEHAVMYIHVHVYMSGLIPSLLGVVMGVVIGAVTLTNFPHHSQPLLIVRATSPDKYLHSSLQ